MEEGSRKKKVHKGKNDTELREGHTKPATHQAHGAQTAGCSRM